MLGGSRPQSYLSLFSSLVHSGTVVSVGSLAYVEMFAPPPYTYTFWCSCRTYSYSCRSGTYSCLCNSGTFIVVCNPGAQIHMFGATPARIRIGATLACIHICLTQAHVHRCATPARVPSFCWGCKSGNSPAQIHICATPPRTHVHARFEHMYLFVQLRHGSSFGAAPARTHIVQLQHIQTFIVV